MDIATAPIWAATTGNGSRDTTAGFSRLIRWSIPTAWPASEGRAASRVFAFVEDLFS